MFCHPVNYIFFFKIHYKKKLVHLSRRGWPICLWATFKKHKHYKQCELHSLKTRQPHLAPTYNSHQNNHRDVNCAAGQLEKRWCIDSLQDSEAYLPGILEPVNTVMLFKFPWNPLLSVLSCPCTLIIMAYILHTSKCHKSNVVTHTSQGTC